MQPLASGTTGHILLPGPRLPGRPLHPPPPPQPQPSHARRSARAGGRRLRPSADAELASVAAAEAVGVRLAARRELQDAAVGLHDSQLTRFNMSDTQVGLGWAARPQPAAAVGPSSVAAARLAARSCHRWATAPSDPSDCCTLQPRCAATSPHHPPCTPRPSPPPLLGAPAPPARLAAHAPLPPSHPSPQRKALGLIGAAGRRGALQNDLAAALGTENRNFFYVVKVGGS